ncbi:MAG: TraB/GumN family protein [Spirochaetaceae bacterium]|nr:MAG: TraB/GumN family protein [Spirochaetaceae bacterium]
MKRMRTRPDRARTRIATVLPVCLVLFLLLPVFAGADVTPPVWRISSASQSLYLIGTVHLMPPEEARLPGHLRSIVESGDVLYFEVDPENLDPGELQSFLLEHAFLPAGQQLSDLLTEDLWSRVQKSALELGLLPRQIAPFRPWYVAQLLTSFAMLEAGLDPDAGNEAQLHLAAARRRIPVRGLETAEEQLQFLASLSEDAQIQLLEQSMDDIRNVEAEIEAILQAWRSNDIDYFEALLDDMREHEELYNAVIVNRHLQWLPLIEDAIHETETPTVVIAVGALHLYGSDGLLSELHRLGYDAEPVYP